MVEDSEIHMIDMKILRRLCGEIRVDGISSEYVRESVRLAPARENIKISINLPG